MDYYGQQLNPTRLQNKGIWFIVVERKEHVIKLPGIQPRLESLRNSAGIKAIASNAADLGSNIWSSIVSEHCQE